METSSFAPLRGSDIIDQVLVCTISCFMKVGGENCCRRASREEMQRLDGREARTDRWKGGAGTGTDGSADHVETGRDSRLHGSRGHGTRNFLEKSGFRSVCLGGDKAIFEYVFYTKT